MVNTSLLDEAVKESGVSVRFICKKLGISTSAYYKKRNGKLKFKMAEVNILVEILRLTSEEAEKIFCEVG